MSAVSEIIRPSDDWYWTSEFAVPDELPQFDIQVESPGRSIETQIGRVVLHYGNTQIYTHSERWDFLDHIYFSEKDTQLYLFDPDEELMDTLFENEFKHSFSPYPSPNDLEAYYDYLRGRDPIEKVAKKILEKRNGS